VPSVGDTRRMGHRHSPKEQRGERGVCCADDGFAAGAKNRVIGVMGSGSPSENIVQSQASKSVHSSAAVRAALFALRFYKSYLSILMAGSCRFEPTCSRYSYEAIERFGVLRGTWLGLKRLLRCHPLSRKFGYDPVPEKWENMSAKLDAAMGRSIDEENCGHARAVSHEVRP